MDKISNHSTPAGNLAQSAQTGTPDKTRWTGEKASAFLRLLARTGKVAATARAVGMSRQSAYRLRARAPLFAQYWDMAMDQAEAARAASRRARRARRSGSKGRSVHPLLEQHPAQARNPGDTSAPPA